MTALSAWIAFAIASQTAYETDFESLNGWTVLADPAGSAVRWAVDADPAGVPGGPSRSGKSLNYNDGIDYDTPGIDNLGEAVSPVIDAGGLSDGRLAFWCNFVTEPGSGPAVWGGHDARYVRLRPVRPDGTHDAPFLVVLGTDPDHPMDPCAEMGNWHRHEWRLASIGPLTRFQVEFGFATTTSGDNGFPGWFVDDLSVAEASKADPAAAAPGAGDDRSSSGNCGLLGPEGLLLLAATAALRRRIRRNSRAVRSLAS